MDLTSLKILAEDLIEAGFLLSTRPERATAIKRDTVIEIGDTSRLEGEFSFEENSASHYLETIRQNKFSWMTFDGSLIQIWYRIRNKKIVAHRYCYAPAPFNGDLRSEPGEQLEQAIDSACLNAALDGTRRGSLRFEFDPEAQQEGHPATHLHVNAPVCRLPVRSPMSPGEFMHFIVKYFYGDLFDHSICGEPKFASAMTITEEESLSFHLGWRVKGMSKPTRHRSKH